jgi:hypothetical protein
MSGRTRAKKPLSCSTVVARTEINKDGMTVPKGATGHVKESRETNSGFQRVTVDFDGVGTLEIAGSKVKCAP